jgi:hypothetical protein
VTPGRYLLLEFVAWLCTTYQASITSWWRSPAHNAAVGGEAGSLHLIGGALDVVYDGQPPALEDVERVARSYLVKVVREGDHDHFQTQVPLLGRDPAWTEARR